MAVFHRFIFTPPNSSPAAIRALADNPRTSLFTVDTISVVQVEPEGGKAEETGGGAAVTATPAAPSKTVVVFSHGNASNILTFYTYIQSIANKFHVTTACYDYPGYGLTPGVPSERSCVAALASVTRHYTQAGYQVLLVGRSLGTGVTMSYCASVHWPHRIVLISPFKSIARLYLDCSGANRLVPRASFDSISKAPTLQCSVYIIHGLADRLVKASHPQALHDAMPSRCRGAPVLFLEGGTHRSVLGHIPDWFWAQFISGGTVDTYDTTSSSTVDKQAFNRT